MTFRYIPGHSADDNKGLVLFNPNQYEIMEIVLRTFDSYDFTLTNSTVWVNVPSESHFTAFVKLLQIRLKQFDYVTVGGI